MEVIIQTLERHFDGAKSQERDWDFFMGLVDYINLIDESPQLKFLAAELIKVEKETLTKLDELEKAAVEELRIVATEIIKIAKKKKSYELNSAIKIFQDWDVGKNEPGWRHSARLSQGINQLLKSLIQKGCKADLEKILPGQKVENPTLLYDICKTYSYSSALSYGFREQEETELWGNYRKIRIAAKIFRKGNTSVALAAEREIIRTDGDYHKSMIFRSNLYGDNSRKIYSSSTDQSIKEFKRNKYQNWLSRVHNHLLKELSKEALTPTKAAVKTLSFDEGKGVLFIDDKKVKFRKGTEQYHTLRIIFSNDFQEEQFFSELAEKIDRNKDYSDKDMHNYLFAIKRRIASETGIKDLFITTTHSVQLNSDYLKN